MKIYITGCKGFLGSRLMERLSTDFLVSGSDREVDITDFKKINEAIKKTDPDIIIHTAALTGTLSCEHDPRSAADINVKGTKNICRICQNNGIKFIHISTNLVFDGKKGNYKESDKTDPISVYGKTKAKAEILVQKLPKYLIIRPGLFYCTDKGFARSVIDYLSKDKSFIGTDEITTPTLVDDLADVTGKLIKKNGIWHVAGPDSMSRYDLAVKIAEAFGLKKELITKKTNKEIGLDKIRPHDVSLNTEKIQKEGIRMHTVKEGLKYLKKK